MFSQCSPFRVRLTRINNKFIDAGDEPNQDRVRQLSGAAKCVGELVGTTRIHAAAAPVVGSGMEAHTQRDDPVLQILGGGFPSSRARATRSFGR